MNGQLRDSSGGLIYDGKKGETILDCLTAHNTRFILTCTKVSLTKNDKFAAKNRVFVKSEKENTEYPFQIKKIAVGEYHMLALGGLCKEFQKE